MPNHIFLAADMDKNAPLHWWHVRDGALVGHGDEPQGEHGQYAAIAEKIRNHQASIILLLPPEMALVKALEVEAMSSAQAEAAARHQMAIAAIDDDVFIASQAHHIDHDDGDNPKNAQQFLVLTATISRPKLRQILDALAAQKLTIDHICPAGLLFVAPEDFLPEQQNNGHSIIAQRVNLGAFSFIRKGHIIVPDEPPMVDMILGEDATDIAPVSDTELENRLISSALTLPLDMRQGEFALKPPGAPLSQKQISLLAILAFVAILLAIAIPLLHIYSMNAAADRVESEILTRAQQTDPNIASIDQLEASLSQKLAAIGESPDQSHIALAPLFNIMRQSPNITLEVISYQPASKMMNAEFHGNSHDDIMAMLKKLQILGYHISASQKDNSANGKAVMTAQIGRP